MIYSNRCRTESILISCRFEYFDKRESLWFTFCLMKLTYVDESN